MRYFQGAPLQVLDLADGWAHVRMGMTGESLEGYIRQERLKYGAEAMREVQQYAEMPAFDEDTPVYKACDEQSEVIDTLAAPCAVKIMGYNEAIDWIGGPETVTAGVLARLEGEINGIILSIQHMEFINLVLQHMIGNGVEDYQYLTELEISALLEVGNIMISAFANAMAGLTDMKIRLTVPAFAVDMQGAIIAVPMAEFGGQSDYIMTIGADFICNGRKVPCRILLSPDVRSLNFLLKKLGVLDEG